MIKYLAEIKTWWDKANDATFFAARVYDLEDHEILRFEFQYGRGPQSLWETLGCESYEVKEFVSEGKMRDVKAWGKGGAQ